MLLLRSATCLALRLGTALSATTAAASSAPAGFPAHYFAPYLELSDSTVGNMAADMQRTGTRFYTLAFLIPQNGCTAQWESGGYPVGAVTSQLNALKSAGGDVPLSFGGAVGGELAQTCTSVSDLTAAYAGIVS